MKITCNGCKKKKQYYAKGMCQNCYSKEYMRKFYEKTSKTTILMGPDTKKALDDLKKDKDSYDTVIRRLLGI